MQHWVELVGVNYCKCTWLALDIGKLSNTSKVFYGDRWQVKQAKNQSMNNNDTIFYYIFSVQSKIYTIYTNTRTANNINNVGDILRWTAFLVLLLGF